jgi:hypothetical protein
VKTPPDEVEEDEQLMALPEGRQDAVPGGLRFLGLGVDDVR